MKVKKAGQITVTVTDTNSATSTSGYFQLFDTRLKIKDTTVFAGNQVDIPILLKAIPAGENIFSFQGRLISYDTSIFIPTAIITTGTPAATFSMSSALGYNYIQFALAGTNPIPGNSVLFKVRGTVNPNAQSGSAVNLNLQDILLNEGTPLPLIQYGTITVAKQYVFTGDGNWDITTNWMYNQIPPAYLPAKDEILIDPIPGGECILNVVQHLSADSKLTVNAGKKFRIPGNLNISH